MQYKFIHFLSKGLYTVILVSCFMIKSINAYADTTDNASCIENNGEISNDNLITETINNNSNSCDNDNMDITINSLSDKVPDKSDESEGVNFWTMCLCTASIMFIILVGMIYRKNINNHDALLRHLMEFDRLYDEYKRYYMYCVEELVKIEKNGDVEKQNTVLSMREDMKQIYNKLIELKKQRNNIAIRDGISNKKALKMKIDTMRYLCKNEGQYKKRLERYLKELQEINKIIRPIANV